MSELNIGAYEGDNSKGVDSLYDALVELDRRTNTYGGIYVVADEVISTGLTPVIVNAFDANMVSNNITLDYANNKITIVDSGNYRVSAQISASGTASTVTVIEIYIDGVASGFRSSSDLASWTGDLGIEAFMELSADQDISLYISDTTGTHNVTIKEGQLTAQLV